MTNWVITRVEQEENESFTWDKVFYKYSGFGVRPYNWEEERFKFANRRNKKTGEYTPM
jgi:hypothetical protein